MEGIAVKHGIGDDHFSVGVQLPSGRYVRPITEDLIQQTRPSKYFALPMFWIKRSGKLHGGGYITKHFVKTRV